MDPVCMYIAYKMAGLCMYVYMTRYKLHAWLKSTAVHMAYNFL